MIVLAAGSGALQSNPRLAGLAEHLPFGQSLLMLIAKLDPPTETTQPATTGLPLGVAARNLTIDFGDGSEASNPDHTLLTYPVWTTRFIPWRILSGLSAHPKLTY